MGYRSNVRCLIYGDTDQLQALITKHELMGSGIMASFRESLKRYTAVRNIGEMVEASEDSEKPPHWQFRDIEVEVLDLYGDDWKWYDGYPDVTAWVAMMHDADTFDCSYEFVRVGEENTDTEFESNVLDEGDYWLGVSRSIECDVAPEERGLKTRLVIAFDN